MDARRVALLTRRAIARRARVGPSPSQVGRQHIAPKTRSGLHPRVSYVRLDARDCVCLAVSALARLRSTRPSASGETSKSPGPAASVRSTVPPLARNDQPARRNSVEKQGASRCHPFTMIKSRRLSLAPLLGARVGGSQGRVWRKRARTRSRSARKLARPF